MKFYKAKMIAQEEGLAIWFDIYQPIHETDCYYYCVNSLNFDTANRIISQNKDKHPVTAIKDSGFIKVRKIAKHGSRIAEPSKEDAIKNLVWRTKLRIGHMKRDIKFCESLVKNHENLSVNYESDRQLIMTVNGTKDLVHEFYSFFF
jgi:hypothetical protein